MPPERIIFPHRYGKPADAWEFGILMFEMLVGRLPERNDETHEVEFGNDLEGLSGMAAALIKKLLSPMPFKRPKFQKVLHHPFIRGQEHDQGIEKPKKKKRKQECQQEASQVTDTATKSQAGTSGLAPTASASAASTPIASALAASDEVTAEELIAFLITPTGDLNQ
ncbi:hypothetical protein BGX24_001616 [Mortierella sp. AD032]|nr:hypothetical protein BGX24_001616 [Mortierella sp. AD032]